MSPRQSTEEDTRSAADAAAEAAKVANTKAKIQITWKPEWFHDANNWEMSNHRVSFRVNSERWEPWTEIKDSGIERAGKGLFAARDFNPQNIIGFYSGVDVSNYDPSEVQDTSYQFTFANKIVDAHPSVCGDGFKHEGWVHKMNDARDPKKYNVYVTACGFVRASRPIKKGQELFLNYGMEYWLWSPISLLEELYIPLDKSFRTTMKTDYPTERSVSDYCWNLSAEEFSDIIEIEKEIYEEPYKFSNKGVRAKANSYYDYNDEEYVWFTVKKLGRVVAYALVDAEYRSTDDFVYLDDLAVSPAHRGKGFAKDIMRRVVEWRENNNRKMFLKVASRLYESFGFVPSDETQRPDMPIDEGYFFMLLKG